MTSSTLSSRLLFAVAVLAVPFASGGCGREACFTWTQLEGACPAQSEALSFFSNPECPGKITSVESEATSELDGTLCCYQVTAREQSDESNCQGFGGASSTASVSQGFGGAADFAASTSVGQGGASTCVHCVDELGGSPPVEPICDNSAIVFKDLFGCLCSGPCSAMCGDSFCADGSFSSACSDCLVDPQGCQSKFNACSNDL